MTVNRTNVTGNTAASLLVSVHVSRLEMSLEQSEQRVCELSQALAQSEEQLGQLQELSQSQRTQIQQLQDGCTQLGNMQEMNEVSLLNVLHLCYFLDSLLEIFPRFRLSSLFFVWFSMYVV